LDFKTKTTNEQSTKTAATAVRCVVCGRQFQSEFRHIVLSDSEIGKQQEKNGYAIKYCFIIYFQVKYVN